MRPGVATLITVLLFLAAVAYAPVWALAVLALLAVATAVVELAVWRRRRSQEQAR